MSEIKDEDLKVKVKFDLLEKKFTNSARCSTSELLPRAVFMHHDDNGHGALKHCSVLKGSPYVVLGSIMTMELLDLLVNRTVMGTMEYHTFKGWDILTKYKM